MLLTSFALKLGSYRNKTYLCVIYQLEYILLIVSELTNSINIKNKSIMKKYVCDVCGWVYDPEVGDPEGGIAPGTAFEDIPDDWVCPLCGVGKDEFSPVEE